MHMWTCMMAVVSKGLQNGSGSGCVFQWNICGVYHKSQILSVCSHPLDMLLTNHLLQHDNFDCSCAFVKNTTC